MALPSPDASTVALLPSAGGTRDEFINGLVQGGSWDFAGGERVLTYSLVLNEEMGTYPGGTPQPGPGATWEERPDMAVAVRRALAAWSAVANVEFEEIAAPPGQYYFESAAHLTFSMTGNDLDRAFSPGTLGLAIFPDSDYVESEVYSEDGHDRATWPEPEGDVFLDDSDEQLDFLDPGGVGYSVILHETAHALGLKHPHDDGGSERPTFDDLGVSAMDRMRYTVMSYDIVEPAPGPSGFAATPMPLDILAIQHIYGANLSYNTGDDIYDLANRSYSTIWDAGGTDAITAASFAAGGVLIDLREGQFSGRLEGARRMAIAYDATIENAVGSGGDDEIIGNGAANRLQGGEGDDRLTGGGGADKLLGGAGRDLLDGAANDFRLHGGAGFDTLRLAGNLDLRTKAGTAVTDIERISLNGGGSNGITLDAASLLDLSTTKDILKVTGDSADTVVIGGNFTDQGISGGLHRYQLGAATLLVDTDIHVLQIQNM